MTQRDDAGLRSLVYVFYACVRMFTAAPFVPGIADALQAKVARIAASLRLALYFKIEPSKTGCASG